MINLEQVDSNTTAWLIIDGQEYELSEFNTNFNQGVDHKGEPQNRVRGGQMQIGITQVVPTNIYDWAMKSMLKDGEIIFKIESGSAPLKISFLNAYCVGFKRRVDSMGGGLVSSLTISPEEVSINGISFDNHWVE
ncbi:type VI secretion system tube protein TssD [Saccharicrinis aurantiacus]|uniref:type VI secretion system tube protein TssD n=1 Tax=Saccharicrinis aurantiacus TaxID=1849719 RepID=UPI0024925952|nr:type VI secretion system tube protein TssD [Saccharicrinis aurantiacus]